ncbi:MAG: hypothetical protein FJY67_05325 [Calditrichaeota bacterium]|nr:hypothetical protein [Calditrichota bacterium]
MPIVQLLQAISIILASITIILGIEAWKREFIGKRRIELAEDVLAKFYEIRDFIAYIRNPFSYSNEFPPREIGEFESSAETAALNKAYVLKARILTR